METKWTPGPWQVLEVQGHQFVAAKPYKGHDYYGRTTTIEVMSDEEYPTKAADAALVAAAPELYAALQLMVDACNKRHFDMEALYQANKAMLKARGEQ